jgi:hypothetical protein
METKAIRPGRVYATRDGTTRRVERVFGRGRNRQVYWVTVAGRTEVPGGGGYDRINDFARWASREVEH